MQNILHRHWILVFEAVGSLLYFWTFNLLVPKKIRLPDILIYQLRIANYPF